MHAKPELETIFNSLAVHRNHKGNISSKNAINLSFSKHFLIAITYANSGPKVAIINFPLLVKLLSPENFNLKVKLSQPDISTKKK